MLLSYDDTNPPSSNSTALAFNVTSQDTTYTLTVSNKNSNTSLGLVVVTFRVPSCYSLNYE